jgi:hypothetical protein
MVMDRTILADLNRTAALLKEHGVKGPCICDVPFSYAQLVRGELLDQGANVKDLTPGAEINVAFLDGNRVTLRVH